jgi:hypothetical protein
VSARHENEALGVAAQAAYTVLVDLGHQPAAVMLIVMMPDGRIRIADGGLSKDAAVQLIHDAPKAVDRYVKTALTQHKKEAH